MAATAAAKNRKIRQEALREQLSQQKHVEKVVDIAKELQEQAKTLESTHIQALRAAADLRMKLVNKYLPDLKAVEIQTDSDDEAPTLNINFNIKEPVGEVKTTHGKPKP